MIITIKHEFETAHRLPFLNNKCKNVHGHSWKVMWMFDIELDEDGITVDYGPLKKALRTWVDVHLDHGIMLGGADPLVDYFRDEEPQQKMYIFGDEHRINPHTDLPWPTVEAVAELLSVVGMDALAKLVEENDGTLIECHVQEKSTNGAIRRRS